MKFRWHRGGLEESMATTIEDTLENILFEIRKTNPGEVTSRYVIFDDRTGWDTHIVLVDGSPVGFADGSFATENAREICEHGGQRRKCTHCELAEVLQESRAKDARIAELEAERDAFRLQAGLLEGVPVVELVDQLGTRVACAEMSRRRLTKVNEELRTVLRCFVDLVNGLPLALESECEFALALLARTAKLEKDPTE